MWFGIPATSVGIPQTMSALARACDFHYVLHVICPSSAAGLSESQIRNGSYQCTAKMSPFSAQPYYLQHYIFVCNSRNIHFYMVAKQG